MWYFLYLLIILFKIYIILKVLLLDKKCKISIYVSKSITGCKNSFGIPSKLSEVVI